MVSWCTWDVDASLTSFAKVGDLKWGRCVCKNFAKFCASVADGVYVSNWTVRAVVCFVQCSGGVDWTDCVLSICNDEFEDHHHHHWRRCFAKSFVLWINHRRRKNRRVRDVACECSLCDVQRTTNNVKLPSQIWNWS